MCPDPFFAPVQVFSERTGTWPPNPMSESSATCNKRGNRIMTFLDWLIVAVIVALIVVGGAAMWVLDRRRR